MPNTFVKIATVTVGSGGTSSINFNSIPSTYTDLCLKISSRSTVSGVNDYPVIKFNGVGTSYSLVTVVGNGSAASSYTDTLVYAVGAGGTQTANTFGNSEFYIPNYAGATNKSVSIDGVNENNATNATTALTAGLWSDTPAITSIAITPFNAGQTFVQYTTATLYGISKT